MARVQFKQRSVLPGFGLSLGYTLLYLGLIVLLPLAAVVVKTSQLTWSEFWSTVTDPRVMASYRLTFGASLIAAVLNAGFGLLVAWVLVRYSFPGRRIVDGLVDLPFALPTAVAGIALTSLYAPNGWLGALGTNIEQAIGLSAGTLAWLNWNFAYSFTGIVVALTFIGLPFVVRTVQPVMQDLNKEVEEAAASLGAGPFQTFWRVILPEIWPALLTGFALAFARAIGEYGSVVFIAGNMPMKTEITALLIITKLEQYQYSQATAIAVVMLVASFTMLLLINILQRWTSRGAV